MERRECYYIDPSQVPTKQGYIPSLVTENMPGHVLLSGQGEGSEPWYWGPTLELAEATCKMMNERRGISEEDAFKIVASSMGSGRVRAAALMGDLRNRFSQFMTGENFHK